MSYKTGKYSDKFGDGFETWPYYDIRDSWVPIVDEALDQIFKIQPGTTIRQIKEKFYDLRIYLALPIETSREDYAKISGIVIDAEEKCRATA